MLGLVLCDASHRSDASSDTKHLPHIFVLFIINQDCEGDNFEAVSPEKSGGILGKIDSSLASPL